jgi:hypothetical protein
MLPARRPAPPTRWVPPAGAIGVVARTGRVAGAGAGGADYKHRQHGGELLGGRVTRDHHRGRRPGVGAHSGMFPCFFGGSAARLVRSIRNARTSSRRVADGAMTAST